MIKSFLKDTIIYGLAPQIVMIINFLILPIITKDLTSIDFGVYGTILAYTTAVSALSSLGLRVVLTNSFYKEENFIEGWKMIYGFLYVWSIFYAVILGGVVYFAVPEEAIVNRWTIVMLSTFPYVFMGQTSLIGMNYYRLKQFPKQIALRSLIFGLMTSFLTVLFISHLKMGYMGWFYSTAIVLTLNNMSYWYPLNKKLNLAPIFSFNKEYLKKSLKISLPTIPHFYAGYILSSSDRLVMDQLGVTTPNIGKYNVSDTFGRLTDGFSTAVGWAIVPYINERYKENKDKEVRNIFFLLQLIYFFITFILSIWLKEFFHIFIKNEELAKMYFLGIILVMSANHKPMYYAVNSKLIFYEKTNILWKISIVAAAINLSLNFALIPIYGFGIAAYTTFISLMFLGFGGHFYESFKDISNQNYYLYIWFFSILLLTYLARIVVEWDTMIKAGITLFYLIATVFMMFRFTKKIKLI